MPAKWGKAGRRLHLAALGAVTLLAPLSLVLAQQGPHSFNEREVRVEQGADKSGVWTLDFRFKDPRLIKVNIPGRGTRICWYLWYQVINRTGAPRKFIPDFELVTLDFPGTYHDELLPTVQDEIKKLEDRTGYQDIHNSVTIYRQDVPPSKPADEAFPRAVTGVAIWDGTSADPKDRDPKKKDLADASKFTIFVSGLSNGWVQVDPLGVGPNARPVIRRKTLQLNFERKGGRHRMESRDISFLPPAEWIYRASQLQVPGGQPPAAPPGDQKKAAFDLRERLDLRARN